MTPQQGYHAIPQGASDVGVELLKDLLLSWIAGDTTSVTKANAKIPATLGGFVPFVHMFA